jgi:tetratricopeptide (TPR) repeat protein
LVTADNWHRLRDKPDFAATALSLPEPLPWFTPFVPDGTAYDLLHRTLRPGCPQPPMVDAITRWAAQAPYELWTGWCAESQRSTDKRPTVDMRRAALGSLADYDLDAVMRLHDHAAVTPEEYLGTATKACQLDDEKCDILADHLVENGREEEAARAYESWITHARDAVGVSNKVTWLVRYYYDMGKRDRAMKIAQMAAETYSARGLETLAHLYDQMGRYEDAEDTYRKINERYENSGQALAAFYLRQSRRTNNPQIEARAKSLVTKQFPNGFEHVTLADFNASPTDGLAFRRLFARAEHIGLREHDIVVAMDGLRVRNIDQYYVVNRVSHDPTMTVVVWRDGRYQELHLTVPQRYFAVVFYDYHPARRGTSASKTG